MLRSVSVLLGLAALVPATPLFTDQEKNAEILKEAALTHYWLLGRLFGVSLGNPLAVTGAFSAGGWSLDLAGVYLGMPVTIAFDGTFDQASNTGSFTSSGTVGSTDVIGTGAWTWTDVSPTEEDLDFSISSIVQNEESDLETVQGHSKQYVKFAKSDQDYYVNDYAVLEVTSGGFSTGEIVVQDSSEIVPIFDHVPKQIDGSATLDDSHLTASAFFPSGKVTGTVSTIPEPACLGTLALGLAVIVVRRSRFR